MPLDNINYAEGQDSMAEAFDKINAAIDAASNISASGTLANVVINIGDWDMDTSDSVNVTHGLSDHTKVVSVWAKVIEDGSVAVYPLSFTSTDGSVAGGIANITSVYIQLTRKIGGAFDNSNFNATSFNRGTITITYEV